jgi:hypothetical protein
MGILSEPLVPCSGSLLEAIEGLVKMADVVRTAGVNKARRQLTVDLLVKIAVEKGVLDVKLVDGPRP